MTRQESIEASGLHHVEREGLAIVRLKAGRGFSYRDAEGRRISDEAVLARIRALAIPPAYRDVRIAVDPRAYLQAIGRDEAGRLQHRYHPDWASVREEAKVDRLLGLIAVLPRIRAAVRRDLAAKALSQAKALACAVALIDDSHIRVGCETYVRTSGSRGASTLLKRQAAVKGGRIELNFRGKGGRKIRCGIRDTQLARALKRLSSLPGSRLIQYRGAGGRVRPIAAADVNAYLRRIAGQAVSAKDLRMLGACAAALEHFAVVEPAASETARRRQVASVMRAVSEHLANTPAVVRKSYVHAVVIEGFADGSLAGAYQKARSATFRRRAEAALGRLVALHARLAPGMVRDPSL